MEKRSSGGGGGGGSPSPLLLSFCLTSFYRSTLFTLLPLFAVSICTLITFTRCRPAVRSLLAPIASDVSMKMEAEETGFGMFTLAGEASLLVPTLQMRK